MPGLSAQRNINEMLIPSPPPMALPEECPDWFVDWFVNWQRQQNWWLRNMVLTAMHSPTNLLVNGGFDSWSVGMSECPDGWVAIGAPTISRQNPMPGTTHYCARITPTIADDGIGQHLMNFLPNVSYTVSFVIRLAAGQTVTVSAITNAVVPRTIALHTIVAPATSDVGPVHLPDVRTAHQSVVLLTGAETGFTIRFQGSVVGLAFDISEVAVTASPWPTEFVANPKDVQSVAGNFTVPGNLVVTGTTDLTGKVTAAGRFDPTSLEISAPAAARPAGIQTGGIWRKSSDGRNYVYTGTTDLKLLLDGEGGSPGGAATNVQINDAGIFYGESLLTWDKVLKILATRYLDQVYSDPGATQAALFQQGRNQDAVVIEKTGAGAGAGLVIENAGTGSGVLSDTDVEVTDSTKGDIKKSPNGTRWRTTVDNAGILVTAPV